MIQEFAPIKKFWISRKKSFIKNQEFFTKNHNITTTQNTYQFLHIQSNSDHVISLLGSLHTSSNLLTRNVKRVLSPTKVDGFCNGFLFTGNLDSVCIGKKIMKVYSQKTKEPVRSLFIFNLCSRFIANNVYESCCNNDQKYR